MSLGSKGGNKLVTSKNYLGNIGRTKLSRNLETRFTCSAGELWPFYVEEIYPAMSKGVKQGSFIRSITPLGPTMDKSFMDVFYFFVPFRLLWDHWEEFIAGYNKEAWTQGVEYTTPQITFDIDKMPSSPSDNYFIGSVLDHIPGCCDVVELARSVKALQAAVTSEYTTKENANKLLNELFGFSALYPRALARLWNDWFRDENYQDELEIYTGDNDEDATEFAFNLLACENYVGSLGYPLKSGKYHNRFTTALPAPQKGPDVLIPMNNLQVGFIPEVSDSFGVNVHSTGSFTAGNLKQLTMAGSATGVSGQPVIAKNVDNTIRMLRLATQTELLLSRDARGGTRYVESLLSHWSAHNGDARLQRSEYLGSRQIPLSVFQITNTTQSESGALGNVGGQSVTKDAAHMFNKSFSEYGVVIGLATIRTNLSYGSGRRKQFTRKGRFEYIWPEFKHVGDVELKATELDQNYAYIDEYTFVDRVLGYTPYGSELREGYNANTGLFRARASGSLGYLTYQEVFDDDDIPGLNEWSISQSSDVVANTLVTQTGPQFYGLIQIIEDSIIPLDPTSDPGLMDHF